MQKLGADRDAANSRLAEGEPSSDRWPPDLLPGADEFLAAFWEMSSDRHIGMTAGPIPLSAIERWAARNGFEDLEEFSVLVSCIREMDSEWLCRETPIVPIKRVPADRQLSMPLFNAMFGQPSKS